MADRISLDQLEPEHLTTYLFSEPVWDNVAERIWDTKRTPPLVGHDHSGTVVTSLYAKPSSPAAVRRRIVELDTWRSARLVGT